MLWHIRISFQIITPIRPSGSESSLGKQTDTAKLTDANLRIGDAYFMQRITEKHRPITLNRFSSVLLIPTTPSISNPCVLD